MAGLPLPLADSLVPSRGTLRVCDPTCVINVYDLSANMSDEKKQKAGLFSRFKKGHKVTALSAAAVLAGTSAASGALSSSDNSAATSRNLQDASKQLDQYLRDMDENDDQKADVISLSRFIEKAESYANSSFAGCTLEQVSM